MPFIHPDFLLSTGTARRLFHQYAAGEPILDYHCHLPPKDIAENRQFANLYEIWLEGDHYKWRAMRANGISERFCTGEASPEEKFAAWASTVPFTLRNPLFHWTHLELRRYFDIDDYLDESSASSIWQRANARLAGDDLRVWGILRKFNVRTLCTTDDPTDTLEWHRQIAASACPARVLPAFRPDKALHVHLPELFNPWVERLAEVGGVDIGSDYQRFLDTLRRRHDFFHQAGARLSDHGLAHCFATFGSDSACAVIFEKARRNIPATAEEHALFASHLMLFFGRLDAEKGWTKQLHLGARRNNNTRLFHLLGPDTGFDSIGDYPQIDALGAYLDRLDQEQALPKIVLYNNNPVDNYAFTTMIGNFQDGSAAGKIQFGSGWWFLDQKEGMEWQLNALSNAGLLSRFVGMLTDSRSFMSYPRHEYFRRTLCNLLGQEVEGGLLPARDDWLGPMIRNICYHNAARYLDLPS